MKIIKKILASSLALSLALTFAACGGSKTESDVNSSANNSSSAPVSSEQKTDDKTLVMATNASFAPYEYYANGESGEIIGIDAEIAKAIADKLGMQLKIEDMAFNSIITSVMEGGVDFGMAGMTVTDERKEQVNFSNTYATGKQVIIVKDGSDIASPDDLKGKKIGVQLTTTGDIYATDDYGKDEDGSLNGNVVEYNTGNEAVLALIGGDVDAVIIDNEPAKSFVASNANANLKILETEYVYEEYAICVAKSNTELLTKLNTAIDELTEDGTIDKIISKYIKAE
ncbi:MAG: transporter substrate-binding domain-containing protein [Oscillospiraceae bacterium]